MPLTRGGWALLLGLVLSACNSVAPVPAPSGFAPCLPSPSTQARSLALPQGLGNFLAPHVPGELLALPGGIAPQTLAARVEGTQVQDRLAEGFLRLRVPVGQERAKAEALLAAGARWVQPNYLYFPFYQPNDPLYPAASTDPYRLQPFYQKINLESAWDKVGPLRCTPVVAVLDTAFNPTHPDLQANLLAGKNLTPDGLNPDDLSPSPPPQGSSYLQGEADHGEGVAGLVAAVANNAQGVPGVGLNYAKVLPVKVFYWVGTSYSVSSDVLANAIRYAADQHAAVINMSLGSPTPLDPAVQQALTYALSKGALPGEQEPAATPLLAGPRSKLLLLLEPGAVCRLGRYVLCCPSGERGGGFICGQVHRPLRPWSHPRPGQALPHPNGQQWRLIRSPDRLWTLTGGPGADRHYRLLSQLSIRSR